MYLIMISNLQIHGNIQKTYFLYFVNQHHNHMQHVSILFSALTHIIHNPTFAP